MLEECFRFASVLEGDISLMQEFSRFAGECWEHAFLKGRKFLIFLMGSMKVAYAIYLCVTCHRILN